MQGWGVEPWMLDDCSIFTSHFLTVPLLAALPPPLAPSQGVLPAATKDQFPFCHGCWPVWPLSKPRTSLPLPSFFLTLPLLPRLPPPLLHTGHDAGDYRGPAWPCSNPHTALPLPSHPTSLRCLSCTASPSHCCTTGCAASGYRGPAAAPAGLRGAVRNRVQDRLPGPYERGCGLRLPRRLALPALSGGRPEVHRVSGSNRN